MQRYKLTIEYDGTPFVGWQYQPGLPTVQGELEKALQLFMNQKITSYASGRTDTGVHALGQVAHINLPKAFEANTVRKALNHFLKNQPIVIRQAEAVSEDFHARFSTKERRYIYKIINQSTPLALEQNRAWHVYQPLDEIVMQEAANHLVGHHDFSSFRCAECQGKSPMKTLDQLDVNRQGSLITITARSRSFLHHQVRNMVGTLSLAGRGKWTADDVRVALEAKDRRAGGPTAPPYGLYFVEAVY
ncbi:MAG: tRNA pseudouridine(38-40) synthase TruA [Alphaproteobacteria bacterium]